MLARGAAPFWVLTPPIAGSYDRRATTISWGYLGIANEWPGTQYVDEHRAFGGPDGGFAAYLPVGPGGSMVKVRADDGVHFTPDGARWFAQVEVATVMNAFGAG